MEEISNNIIELLDKIPVDRRNRKAQEVIIETSEKLNEGNNNLTDEYIGELY